MNAWWRQNRHNRQSTLAADGSARCVGSVGTDADRTDERDFPEDKAPAYSDADLDRWAAEAHARGESLGDATAPLAPPACSECGAPAPTRHSSGWSACQHQIDAGLGAE